MFNLFPKKKSVDEILEDNGVSDLKAFQKGLIHERDTARDLLATLTKENDKLKKDVEDQKQLKDSLQRVNEKYIKKITEQQNSISELTKEVRDLRHLKTENVELIDRLKNETQKHPMYPLHWGGYDKNIIDFVESEFSNEDPLEGKQVEFNAEELLKRVTEYADSLDTLPKSFPDEFQKEKSWEEAASDLALRVVKLERMVENQMLQIEELKVDGVNLNNRILDANYEHFKKYGKWPWGAMNSDGTLKTIPC